MNNHSLSLQVCYKSKQVNYWLDLSRSSATFSKSLCQQVAITVIRQLQEKFGFWICEAMHTPKMHGYCSFMLY